MDVAYDHIQEEALSPDESKDKQLGEGATPRDLNSEVREAYKAISSSPWGAKLGGLWGTVKKQSETYISEARKELTAVSTEASKNLNDLMAQTKSISLSSDPNTPHPSATTVFDPSDPSTFAAQPSTSTSTSTSTLTDPTTPVHPQSVNSLTSESLLNEAATLFSRFQSATTSRLAQLSAAEDRADEAIERLGTNLRDFLRTSITVAPPAADSTDGKKRFESKDAEGRRVVHATRFDAQLHVIHTTLSNFTADPVDDEFASWKAGFDVNAKTEDIATDLAQYEELRRTMEKLVPEKVEYKVFWARYYFLRWVVESEERKRRELLKDMGQGEEEEIGWGDEDDEVEVKDSSATSTAPVQSAATTTEATPDRTGSTTPTITTSTTTTTASDTLKPSDTNPRRSNEHSVADSDASYDILSSATTSRGPGTPAPILDAKESSKEKKEKAEESDEEDWE